MNTLAKLIFNELDTNREDHDNILSSTCKYQIPFSLIGLCDEELINKIVL